jgi:hypothetical protein
LRISAQAPSHQDRKQLWSRQLVSIDDLQNLEIKSWSGDAISPKVVGGFRKQEASNGVLPSCNA